MIHSSAPLPRRHRFDPRISYSAWLVDATLLHDTFAKEGRKAFPDLPISRRMVSRKRADPTEPLGSPPLDWKDEIDVLKLNGNRMNEHALFHRRSATLVLRTYSFSFRGKRADGPAFLSGILCGCRVCLDKCFLSHDHRDRQAFKSSMKALLQWQFDRLVVAHREPLDKDAEPT